MNKDLPKHRSAPARALADRKYHQRVKQDKRRSAIIRELSKMSRDGWRDARSYDYQPLERELHQINGDV